MNCSIALFLMQIKTARWVTRMNRGNKVWNFRIAEVKTVCSSKVTSISKSIILINMEIPLNRVSQPIINSTHISTTSIHPKAIWCNFSRIWIINLTQLTFLQSRAPTSTIRLTKAQASIRALHNKPCTVSPPALHHSATARRWCNKVSNQNWASTMDFKLSRGSQAWMRWLVRARHRLTLNLPKTSINFRNSVGLRASWRPNASRHRSMTGCLNKPILSQNETLATPSCHQKCCRLTKMMKPKRKTTMKS